MAQDAELLLKVGLDLSHFRGQLNRLGADLAGQALNLSIKFNRTSISSELNLLQRQLGNKVFRVEVNTNLKTETDRAEKLANSLKELQGLKITAPVTGVASVAKREASKIRSEIRRAVLQQGGKITVPVAAEVKQQSSGGKFTQRSLVGLGLESLQGLYKGLADAGLASFDESIINNKAKLAKRIFSIGKDVVAGFLNGIESDDPKVKASAEALGKNFLNTLKAGLGIASPSKETAKLGKFATQGFVLGFINELVRSERKIANAITRSAVGFIYEGLSLIGDLGPAFAPLERQLKAGALRAVRRAFRDGLKEAAIPALKGGLLGLLGGGATGGLIGGFQGAAGSISSGLTALGAGGQLGMMRQLGRLTIGDTSGLTTFVQELAAQAMHHAFSTGTLGAIVGAAAVGGVTGSSGFIRGTIKSVARQLTEAIINKIAADIDSILAMEDIGGNIGQSLKRFFNILARRLDERLTAMAIAFPPMMKALPPAYRGLPPAPGPAGFLPPAYRGLPPARDAKMLSAAAAPAGLLTAISQTTARRASVEALIKGLPSSEEPPGKLFPLERMLQMLRERLEQMLSIETIRISEDVAADLKKGLYGFSMIANALNEAEAAAKRARIEAKVAKLVAALENAIDIANASVRIRQVRVASLQIAGVPERLALPPAGGTVGSKRMGGGYVPPGGFPTAGPVPPQGPKTTLSLDYYKKAFKYAEALKVAEATTKNFSAAQLPLIGGLRELGGEFAMATKQVLLYGTAYRGLAFVTSLPSQVLNAAKAQQQYNNSLQTATQDTGTFAKELLFVDNVQRAFGLNLETTRTGFTRLFASMAPTGFDSGSIEKLFTGISAATAALQLTPDKAERVIYAFGQMASKGQIMSEELKGQLGDVLPGALALFADAAGMSVREFSQAMEDGEFKGRRFREVFAQVSDELMKRFGTGAQAAGRSLQGLLNVVQGDFQRTLESFAPLANAAAQAILVPLSQSLSQLSKSAQIAFGEQERVAKQLQDAKRSNANAQSIAALEARLTGLNAAAKDPAISQQAKNIEALVVQVSRAAKAVADLAGGLGRILGPILVNLGTNLTSIIQTLTVLVISFNAVKLSALAMMAVLTTMKTISGISAQAAVSANLLAGAYRLLGVQATAASVATIGFGTAIKALLASTGIGLLVVALGSVAAAFMAVGDKAAEAAQRTKIAMDKMQDSIRSGNVELARADLLATEKQRQNLEDAVKLLDQLEQKGRRTGRGGAQVYAQTTLVQRMRLEAAGLDLGGRIDVDVNQLRNQINPLRQELKNLQQRQKIGVNLAEEQKRRLGMSQPKPSVAAKAEEDLDKEKTEKKKTYVSELAQLLKQEMDIELNKINQDSNLSDRQREIQAAAKQYQYELLINKAEYNKGLADENKKDITNRQVYLDELKKTFDNENELSRQRYEDVVTRPFRNAIEQETNAIIELQGRLKALSEGRSEQNAVETMATFIKQKLNGLDEETIKTLEPLLKLLRQLAITRKNLTDQEKRQAELAPRLKQLQDEIRALRAITDAEKRLQEIRAETANKGLTETDIKKIYDLEQIKKNLEQTRALIDDFVKSTTNDYKGFLKAIIQGEDAADALEQFQKALADRVLTIFLDFSFAPIEQFMQEALRGIFLPKNIPGLEEGKTKEATPVEANTEATKNNTTAIEKLTAAINSQGGNGNQASQQPGTATAASILGSRSDVALESGISAAVSNINFDSAFQPWTESFNMALENVSQTLDTQALALKENVTNYSSSFQEVGDSANKMAENAGKAAEEAKNNGNKFQESLNKVAGGIGIAAGAIMGIAAGIKQIEKGDAASVIGGIGSILMGLGGGIGGFVKLFAANGGVATNGWKPFPVTPFAGGGMVTGPTLGLVGEGKYNEAIVPLPDGRSIPVQLQGESIRDKMGDGTRMMAMPMLSMSFQSTTINGVEYVDRAQLEAAMAETRKMAVREGATRGASLALDKLANSPSSRRRVGMR